MRDLSVNQLLEYPDEGKIERILWVDPAMSGLYAIDIHAPTAMPVFREAEEMERMRETGEWRVTEADPWLAFLADEGIPETYRSKRDRAGAQADFRDILVQHGGYLRGHPGHGHTDFPGAMRQRDRGSTGPAGESQQTGGERKTFQGMHG